MWTQLLHRLVRTGTLVMRLPDGETLTLGKGEPQAEILIRDTRALRRIALDPGMQVGETYVLGMWDPGRGGLLGTLEFLFSNLRRLESRHSPVTGLKRGVRWLSERNNALRSRRNVSHHYDLNESLYRSFLDQDLQYSCAYFEQPDLSLEAAQQAKCRHLARKLLLKPGERILDIGSGWGGLALYLAREHSVEVTGLTLSSEQLRVARQRAAAMGLSNSVEFRLEDYRQHDGQYDAIVSVGMFEHVGRPQYPEFFTDVYQILKPGGRAVLHSIGRSGPPTASNPWMQQYIFPGSYIPALSEFMAAIEDSGLVLSDLEILHSHYALTLAHWHERFQSHREDIAREMGERFCRIWEFYLQASEASFLWYDLNVYQLQMTREARSAPMTRDYLYAAETEADSAEEQSQMTG